MHIVYRMRTQAPYTFYEFLFVPNARILQCPDVLPARFENRVREQSTIDDLTFSLVDSRPSNIEGLARDHILNGSGTWLLPSDCIFRGEFLPEQIPGLRQFFGIFLQHESCEAVLKFFETIKHRVNSNPLSLYHGTATTNEESILTYGFQTSFGMLGHGVYLSTFWKAARFAVMTHDYVHRYGSVFRVMAFCNNLREYPKESWMCSCDRCRKIDWASKYADHAQHWKELGYDGATAASATEASGVCRDGKPKFPLKNAEWVTDAKLICITHYARVDQQSMGMAYDPLWRDTQIL